MGAMGRGSAGLKVTAQQRKAARALVRQQKSPKEALLGAGYSPSTAQRGAQEFFDTDGLKAALLAEIRACNEIALPTPDERASFVRWRLLMNALTGRDSAVQSLKLLGSDRALGGGLFATEAQQVGVILIQPSERTERLLADLAPELPVAPGQKGDSRG